MREDYGWNISDIHKTELKIILWIIHNVRTLREGGRVESALGGEGITGKAHVRFIFENFGRIAHPKGKSQDSETESIINFPM